MTDGIMKGNGASRYLKTIASGLSQYPTYEDFMAALVEGTFPVDLFGRNPGGWTQEGTLLNKASLLTDEAAQTHGLAPDSALVSDMWFALIPAGAVFWMAMETVPSGYLLCDGSAVSRADYPRLFRAIGTKFGTGDGSTTFKIPDLRAAFIRGAGQHSIHSAPFGSSQSPTMLSLGRQSGHSGSAFAGGLYSGGPFANSDGSTSFSTTDWTASPGPERVKLTSHAIRPYNIALTPVIKY